ncbi:hypothetical protein MTO96_006688 [Rhipicephalus appendiculatus]
MTKSLASERPANESEWRRSHARDDYPPRTNDPTTVDPRKFLFCRTRILGSLRRRPPVVAPRQPYTARRRGAAASYYARSPPSLNDRGVIAGRREQEERLRKTKGTPSSSPSSASKAARG